MSFNLIVKEINLKTFLLTGKIFNKKIINNLINFIKDTKDEKLSYKTSVKGHFTGFQSLVTNVNFVNFLQIIQPQIKIIFQNNFIINSAWGNICKYNEEIIEHNHKGTTAFCGILYLSEGGPGTFFKEYNLTVEEEIGKYVLFHPVLNHSVKKIKEKIDRITLAFNMNEISDWNKKEILYINKN